MTTSDMPAEDLLSILIPSYDRPLLAERLVRALDAQRRRSGLPGVEIVLADNASPPPAEKFFTALASDIPNFKYLRHPKHFSTGEQNIFHSIPHCSGKYVWCVSDDDVPHDDAIGRLVDTLKEGSWDFLISNLSFINMQGELFIDRMVTPTGLPEKMTFAQIAQSFGFVSTASCCSAYVLRRDMIDVNEWRKFEAISPVYSHVSYLMSAFSDRNCGFISDPLFAYRTDAVHTDNWKVLSRRQRQQYYFPWTIGLSRLLRELRSRGLIDKSFFANVVEHDQRRQFNLARSVLATTTEQILRWLDTGEDGEMITVEEFDEIAQEYGGTALPIVDAVQQLRRLLLAMHQLAGTHEAGAADDPLVIALESMRADRQIGWRVAARQEIKRKVEEIRVRFVPDFKTLSGSTYGGYRVIFANESYYAVPPDSPMNFGQTIHFYRDLAEQDSNCIRSSTLASLRLELTRIYGTDEQRIENGALRELAGFDEDFYLSQVRGYDLGGLEPLEHYRTVGWRRGASPNSRFNVTAYLDANPDVRSAGIEPFQHYIEWGFFENRPGV